MPDPSSPRLVFSRVRDADAPDLQRLALDAHVRRYLLDGEVVPPGWAEAEVARSDSLFAARGVGLWLLRLRGESGPVGFAGFRLFPEYHAEDPELLYALLPEHCGRGLATEAAGALIEFAQGQAGFEAVVAAVDAPNAASVRVLEKLGFRETGSAPGAFRETLLFQRPRVPCYRRDREAR